MQQVNKNLIKRCFNKAGQTYDLYSEAQHEIGLELIKKIPKKYYPAQMDLGCGTGWLTKHLIETHAAEYCYALDFSENLLNIAKARLHEYPVVLLQHDFDDFVRHDAFDLIYSSMALHWSRDFSVCINNLFQNIKPDGCLAFSIPLRSTFHELSDYSIQSFMELDQINQIIKNAGFSQIECSEKLIKLVFDSKLAALKMIKSIGANYVPERKLFAMNKAILTDKNPFELTYHIGYFVARKIL